jgi:two-component system CheB/CheR fusion protein
MGFDFSHYKFNTLYRRVTRRMVLLKIEGVSRYVQLLRENPPEVEALYQDILINVTSFFRDAESFDALKRTVFPGLLKDRPRNDPVRIWTLGCSTGQEAYSLAMAFMESAEALSSPARLQLFATDLNATGVEKARAGVYPKDIAQDVSPERLRQFFTRRTASCTNSATASGTARTCADCWMRSCPGRMKSATSRWNAALSMSAQGPCC